MNLQNYLIFIHKFAPHLFCSILIVTLFFGLYPKGFYFKNNAGWSADSPGIDFGKFSIAHTEPFIEGIGGAQALSIDILIRPDAGDRRDFSHILTLHNGDDESQLMMGQWRGSIVFMNGNDYENKKKSKRIWANTADADSDEIFVTVTSGAGGTSLYLNGQLAEKKKDLILKIPEGGGKSRLIIGNSVYGKESWTGKIRGLAFYRNVLSDQQAALHYSEWMKEGNLRFTEKEKPWILYVFDEKRGMTAIDHGTGGNNLTIPDKMTVFKKALLQTSVEKLKKDNGFIGDFIINLFGFMPFGFLFSALLLRFRGKAPVYYRDLCITPPFARFHRQAQISILEILNVFLRLKLSPSLYLDKIGRSSKVSYILPAAGAGFLLSLSIETLQAWLPSRNSDAFDLILNTTGAFLGSLMFMLARRGIRDRNQSSEARGQ